MSKIVIFNDAEFAEPGDWSNIGVFSRATEDSLSVAGLGWPNHWSRFTVAKTGVTRLAISAGELHQGGVIYSLDEQVQIDLQDFIPVTLGNDRWIVVVARPRTGTLYEERARETGEQPLTQSKPVPTTFPKIDRRYVEFEYRLGFSGPAPQDRPVPAAGEAALCYVRLTVAGIDADSIEPAAGWRVKSVYEIDGRVTVLEGRLDITIQRTSTLETDLANLSARMRLSPRPEIIRQMQRSIGALERRFGRPDAARAYWYDNGLTQDAWDKTHVDWLARVREGIRFGFAQIVDSQLVLTTPGDPALTIRGNLALPKFTEEVRIEVDGPGSYKDISDRTHTVVEATERSISGVSISYGPSFAVCENQSEWQQVATVRAGETFSINGQTYVSDGYAQGNLDNQWGHTDLTAYNADPAVAGHHIYAVQQAQYNAWTSTYWEYVTKSYGVNGSVYGQTYLVSQTMIVTSIDLKPTRIATDGDLHLSICETDATAKPLIDRTIGGSDRSPAQLTKDAWSNFPLRQPVLREAGRRDAFFTTTNANYALATVEGNKFAQGSLFWITDGAWAQGDNIYDFAFRIRAPKFDAVRTVIEFQPVNCPDGMTEIQLLYNGFAPAGTSLTWEVSPAGDTQWYPIMSGDPAPLNGLPAQARLRATFVGTTDLQPGIVLDNTARVAAMRIRNTAVAVSKLIDLGISSTTIVVQTRMDNYDPAYNSFAATIIAGGVTRTPSVTEIEPDPDKPGRYVFTAEFDLPAAVTSLRVRPTFATTNLRKACFIQDISMHAL